VIDRLGGEVGGLLLEERLDVTGRDVDQPPRAERRADDVLSDRPDALRIRRALREELLDPPCDHCVDRAASVPRRSPVDAIPRAILGDLDLAQELDCVARSRR
jgi:hypothetical protein